MSKKIVTQCKCSMKGPEQYTKKELEQNRNEQSLTTDKKKGIGKSSTHPEIMTLPKAKQGKKAQHSELISTNTHYVDFPKKSIIEFSMGPMKLGISSITSDLKLGKPKYDFDGIDIEFGTKFFKAKAGLSNTIQHSKQNISKPKVKAETKESKAEKTKK